MNPKLTVVTEIGVLQSIKNVHWSHNESDRRHSRCHDTRLCIEVAQLLRVW